jgi:hypothetical protein
MLSPGLSGIVTALTRSRKIFHRLDSYLIFRIAVSCDVAIFFFIAAVAMHFIVPTYVIVLIALINDCIMISMSFDFVTPSPLPVEWNIAKVITISGLMSAFCIGQVMSKRALFIYFLSFAVPLVCVLGALSGGRRRGLVDVLQLDAHLAVPGGVSGLSAAQRGHSAVHF